MSGGFGRFKAAYEAQPQETWWRHHEGKYWKDIYADFCSWGGVPVTEAVDMKASVEKWLAALAEGRWPRASKAEYSMDPNAPVFKPVHFKEPAPPEGPAACGTEWVADGQVQFGAPMDRQPTATSTLKEPRCSSCGGEWDQIGRKCWRRCWRSYPVHGE